METREILGVLRKAMRTRRYARIEDFEGKIVDGYVVYVNANAVLWEQIDEGISEGYVLHRLNAIRGAKLQPSDAMPFWLASEPSETSALPFAPAFASFEEGVQKIAALSPIAVIDFTKSGRKFQWIGRIEGMISSSIQFQRLLWPFNRFKQTKIAMKSIGALSFDGYLEKAILAKRDRY